MWFFFNFKTCETLIEYFVSLKNIQTLIMTRYFAFLKTNWINKKDKPYMRHFGFYSKDFERCGKMSYFCRIASAIHLKSIQRRFLPFSIFNSFTALVVREISLKIYLCDVVCKSSLEIKLKSARHLNSRCNMLHLYGWNFIYTFPICHILFQYVLK